jgi:hypothetical protein
VSHTNEIEAFRMFHRRVSAVQLDECRIGVTRSAGTRRIPTDDHSVAPPNVAWWPPRWPIEDVSDGGGTRRRALPGVLHLFECATRQNPTGSLLRGTHQEAWDGPGRRGEWNTKPENNHGTAGALAQAAAL